MNNYEILTHMKKCIENKEELPQEAENLIRDFIHDWIIEMKRNDETLEHIINIFDAEFKYKGEMWRGVFVEEGKVISEVNGKYLSLTNYPAVAYYHANYDDSRFDVCEYGLKNEDKKGKSYLIKIEDAEAFSFDDFLIYLQAHFTDTRLLNDIDSFLWENEKIVTNLGNIKYEITELKLPVDNVISCDPLL